HVAALDRAQRAAASRALVGLLITPAHLTYPSRTTHARDATRRGARSRPARQLAIASRALVGLLITPAHLTNPSRTTDARDATRRGAPRPRLGGMATATRATALLVRNRVTHTIHAYAHDPRTDGFG